MRIAKLYGAEKYAAGTYEKAVKALEQAQDYHDRRAGNKPVSMMSREAVQRSEDARVISLKRQDEERLAAERKAAADREAKAKAEAEAEARRRRQAEMERAAAEKAKAEADLAARRAADERAAADRARADAEKARLEAEAARQQAEAARLQAEAAKAAAVEQQRQLAIEADKAKQAALESDRLRAKAEQEKADLRQRLRDQLNMVLETRDSARGLIVNMSDVLFDFGKYTLKQDAREAGARGGHCPCPPQPAPRRRRTHRFHRKRQLQPETVRRPRRRRPRVSSQPGFETGAGDCPGIRKDPAGRDERHRGGAEAKPPRRDCRVGGRDRLGQAVRRIDAPPVFKARPR